MTACIVGWAHTPFGKLDTETVESLIVRVTNEALEHAGIGAEDVDEVVLGHFNGGFSAQDFTASLVFQASDRFRFKPATRVENACATGSAAVHQAIKTIEAEARQDRARGRRRADDDARRGRRSATSCSRPPICRRTATRQAALPACSARSRARYFQRHGDQSDALGDDRRQEPQERGRQSLRADAQGSGLRFLPRRERQEPLRGRSPEAHRLLARVRRRRGSRPGRHGDGAAHAAGGGLPRHGPCAGFPADVEARHHPVRGLRGSVAARPGPGRHRSSTTCPSSRPTTASPSPNSSSTRPWA